MSRRCRVARAAPLQSQLGTDIKICDTVRLSVDKTVQALGPNLLRREITAAKHIVWDNPPAHTMLLLMRLPDRTRGGTTILQ